MVDIRCTLYADLPPHTFLELAQKAETLADLPSTNETVLAKGRRPAFARQPHRRGWPLGVNLYCAGWAYYRAEDYERAINRLQQVRSLDPDWRAGPISYPLLALSYHRAGRVDESLQALDRSQTALNSWLDEALRRPADAPPIPIAWVDWLEFLTNHHEACVLIKKQAPAIDARMTLIEARSLAAIK
jgi:tetratricopeptide (TPR) repeat protein